MVAPVVPLPAFGASYTQMTFSLVRYFALATLNNTLNNT